MIRIKVAYCLAVVVGLIITQNASSQVQCFFVQPNTYVKKYNCRTSFCYKRYGERFGDCGGSEECCRCLCRAALRLNICNALVNGDDFGLPACVTNPDWLKGCIGQSGRINRAPSNREKPQISTLNDALVKTGMSEADAQELVNQIVAEIKREKPRKEGEQLI